MEKEHTKKFFNNTKKRVSAFSLTALANLSKKNGSIVLLCLVLCLGQYAHFVWKYPQIKSAAQELLAASCLNKDENTGCLGSLLGEVHIVERPAAGELRFILNTAAGKAILTASELPWNKLFGLENGEFVAVHAVIKAVPQKQFGLPNPVSYESYLMRRDILVSGKVFVVDSRSGEKTSKKKFSEEVLERFGKTEAAAVLIASTLGEKDFLDDEATRLFRETGLSHLLVVSGFHLGVLFLTLSYVSNLVFRRSWLVVRLIPAFYLADVLGILVTSWYAWFTGGIVSTIRALIALALVFFGRLISRQVDVVAAFFIVLLMILLIWPGALFEVGAQLTFLAVLGLLLAKYFWDRYDSPAILALPLKTFVFSLLPSLLTAPVVYLWFGTIVPLSVLYNFLFAFAFSAIFLVLGGISLFAFYLNLTFADYLLVFTLSAAKYFLLSLRLCHEAAENLGLGYINLS